MKQFLLRIIAVLAVFLPKQVWAQETSGTENGYAWVDLGLSVRWATVNVGATQPYDYGLYFAWGDTRGYTSDTSDGHNFGWENYKWCNGSSDTMTKYCTDSSYGTVDNKTTLDLEDDAAAVNMGGSWRMPTKAEQDELRTQCTWTWQAEGNADYNGVAGYKVTGTNGNSIFLPAAGDRNDASIGYPGTYGYYWSASLFEYSPDCAYYVNFISGVDWDFSGRCYGLSVRAVLPKSAPVDELLYTETVTAFSSPSFTVTLNPNRGTAQYFTNYYRLGNGGSLTLTGKSNVDNIVNVKMNLQDPTRSGSGVRVSSGTLVGDSITDVNATTLTVTSTGYWPQLWLSSLDVTYEGSAPQGTYAILLPQYQTNGSVTSDKDWADEGDVVTLTATPNEGYHLARLYANRGQVTLAPADASNQYTFTMPAEDVTVQAVFAEGDITTGVLLNEPEDSEAHNAPIYNLQGQRLKHLQRGVNIVGGRKKVCQ